MKKFFISVYTFIYKNGVRFLGGKGLHTVCPFGQVYDYVSGKVRTHDWPEVQIIHGHAMYAPPAMRGGFAIYKGKREALEFRLFERETPTGGTAIDVGANIGFYALPLARAVGANGRVFAFEPAPANLEFLRKNIAANGYANVTVVPKAVGAASGSTKLFLAAKNPGGHQTWDMKKYMSGLGDMPQHYKDLLDDARDDYYESVAVDQVSLDEFFTEYEKPIHFMKIDVEGAEGGVIAGAKKILGKNKGMKLHFEFNPSLMWLFGTDPLEYLKTLEGLGFVLYSLADYKRGIDRLLPFKAEALLASCPGNKSDEVFARRG